MLAKAAPSPLRPISTLTHRAGRRADRGTQRRPACFWRWRRIVDQLWRIITIGMRDWARGV
jgi:hypothetical protein